MLGLSLALALASAPAVPRAADDPMNSTREVGPFFATLQIDQPIRKDTLPLLGARLTGVFQRRFGLEASVSTTAFAKLSEVSAVGVIKLVGDPVLLRVGVSHIPGRDTGDHRSDAVTGFHVGASLLSGDEDDRVRFRLDYTYRQFGRQDLVFSSVGLGLVLSLASD